MRAAMLGKVAVALVFSVVTMCVAAATQAYKTPAIGSSWVSRYHDSGSYGSGRYDVAGSLGERAWEGRKLLAFKSAQGESLVQADGAFVGALDAAGRLTMSWEPPAGWSYPLEVGKHWTRRTTMKLHANGGTTPVEFTQSVEAYEDVTVPAGTFKAYRVRSIDSLGNDNLTWFAPEPGFFVKQILQRTSKHAQGEGRRVTELKTLTRGVSGPSK